MKTCLDFIINEKGLETVEYAMILAFISAGLIAAIVVLSGAVQERFNEAANTVTSGS
jgi:Flp pilus assembly pilin Flp